MMAFLVLIGSDVAAADNLVSSQVAAGAGVTERSRTQILIVRADTLPEAASAVMTAGARVKQELRIIQAVVADLTPEQRKIVEALPGVSVHENGQASANPHR